MASQSARKATGSACAPAWRAQVLRLMACAITAGEGACLHAAGNGVVTNAAFLKFKLLRWRIGVQGTEECLVKVWQPVAFAVRQSLLGRNELLLLRQAHEKCPRLLPHHLQAGILRRNSSLNAHKAELTQQVGQIRRSLELIGGNVAQFAYRLTLRPRCNQKSP